MMDWLCLWALLAAFYDLIVGNDCRNLVSLFVLVHLQPLHLRRLCCLRSLASSLVVTSYLLAFDCVSEEFFAEPFDLGGV